MMDKTLTQIDNIKMKAEIISVLKRKFSQKQLNESLDYNFELLRKELQSRDRKDAAFTKKFEQFVKKCKNSSYDFVVHFFLCRKCWTKPKMNSLNTINWKIPITVRMRNVQRKKRNKNAALESLEKLREFTKLGEHQEKALNKLSQRVKFSKKIKKTTINTT